MERRGVGINIKRAFVVSFATIVPSVANVSVSVIVASNLDGLTFSATSLPLATASVASEQKSVLAKVNTSNHRNYQVLGTTNTAV